LDFTPGISSAKSFLSFHDTRISSTLRNVGVSMGKNVNEVSPSVSVLKHMKIDRLKVSPKYPSALPNPETEEEEEEANATYDGLLLSHLVGVVTKVGLDEARPGSMFCDFTASSRKSKSHSSKKNKNRLRRQRNPRPEFLHKRHVLEQQRSFRLG